MLAKIKKAYAATAVRVEHIKTFVEAVNAYWKEKRRRKPPTDKERREAQNNLRLALERIELSNQGGIPITNGIIYLEEAAKAVRHAARLDPNVRLTVELKDGDFTYDPDYLAAKICSLESDKHVQKAKSLEKEKGYPKSYVNSFWKLAYKSAAKSLQYKPDNIDFLHQYARVAAMFPTHYMQARKAITKAEQLDPDNIETIRLKREIALW